MLIAVFLIAFLSGASSGLTVALISPQDGNLTNGSNNTVAFTFNFTGETDNASCGLYLDGIIAASNSSTVPDTGTVLYSDRAFDEGANAWNVSCSSTSQNGSSQSRTLNVDTRPPVWITPRSHSTVRWRLSVGCFGAAPSFLLLNSTTMGGDDSAAQSEASVYRQFFFNPGAQCFAGEARLTLWNE